MSTVAASPFSAVQLSTLLGVTSPTQDVANGLVDLLAPTSPNPVGAMDGILEALTPVSGSSNGGLASLFGPATTIDPGTAGILESIQQAEDSANAVFDQSLPVASTSTGQSGGASAPSGGTVDISA